MSNPFYKMYYDQTIKLVDTLVIKSDVAAMKLNEGVQVAGYPIDIHPENWKYYLNLNGQYHESDEPMFVISTDTLEEISFDKETLKIHRATARAYEYGTDYYNNLVSLYPEQEMLILGILNPIDINTALSAYDGEILYYDKELVEQQETSLIPRIQEYINSFYTRWHVKGYIKTDEYYPATMYGILIVNLIHEIMNIRTELCKTNEAHSFHITRYLASHLNMDEHVRWFTLKQKLFFYRNIKYLINHAGKSETFDLLIQKVLTDRRIPLASYDLEHNIEELIDKLEAEVVFEKRSVNPVPDDGSDVQKSTSSVIASQSRLAKGNDRDTSIEIEKVTTLFKDSSHNTLRTKLLESSMLDTSENVPITISDILVNNWLYLASNNRYLSQISIMNPSTGVKFGISVSDALPLYFYAVNKSVGLEIHTVPYIKAMRVRKPVLPSKSELMSLVGNNKTLEDDIETMMEYHPPMGLYISVDSYVNYCTEVFNNQNRHRFIVAHAKSMLDRAMLEQVNHAYYMDVECHFDTGREYSDWLSERNIDVSEFTEFDFESLASEILNVATGADLSSVNVTLGDIQKAMLSVMEKLSSYSVQYLDHISILSNRLIDFPGLRLNQISLKRHLARTYELPSILNGRFDYKLKSTYATTGRVIHLKNTTDKIVPEEYSLNLGYHLKQSGKITDSATLHLGRSKFTNPTEEDCGEL